MTTRLEIINRALVRIGADPLDNETVDGAETHLAIYAGVSEDLLSRNEWSFATVTRRLTRLADAPAQHWRYQYQLPSEMLGSPRAVYDSDALRWPMTAYALSEQRLLTDAEAVWLKYIKTPDPTWWPGYFRELVTVAMMAELAFSVREDRVTRDALRGDVYGSANMLGQGGLLGEAKGLDAQSKPSPVIAEGSNPLIAARY